MNILVTSTDPDTALTLDEKVRELDAFVQAIGAVLINNNLCTAEELFQAKTIALQRTDQILAPLRQTEVGNP